MSSNEQTKGMVGIWKYPRARPECRQEVLPSLPRGYGETSQFQEPTPLHPEPYARPNPELKRASSSKGLGALGQPRVLAPRVIPRGVPQQKGRGLGFRVEGLGFWV